MIKLDLSSLLNLEVLYEDLAKSAAPSHNGLRAVQSAGDAYVRDVMKVAPVRTGQYRSNMRADSMMEGGKPVCKCGDPMPQTRRLEFGFHGADSLGRIINQHERPHWRSMWYVHLEEYKSIINRIITQDVHMK